MLPVVVSLFGGDGLSGLPRIALAITLGEIARTIVAIGLSFRFRDPTVFDRSRCVTDLLR